MTRIFALIAARGGSKRLPRKNARLLGGKPLISWSIEAARASPAVERILVSTDDPEIASIAESAGAEVPFMRPADLATDKASQVDVITHALDWLAQHDGEPDYLMLLQPTSPLRTSDHITEAVEIVRMSGAESVASVTPASVNPLLMFYLSNNGIMTRVIETSDPNMRTQDMPPAFVLNGAIYLFTPRFIRQKRRTVDADTLGFVMPAELSIDIDELEDFERAERYLKGRGAPSRSQ